MDFSIIEEMDNHCATLCSVMKQQSERLCLLIQKLMEQHLPATDASDGEMSDITDSNW